MRLIALSAFILCNFHVYKWEKAYIKDFNAWRFLMIFFFIYLDEGRGWVCALMHVYVFGHIVSLCYRTAWWVFTKLGRDEVLMALHLWLDFSENPAQGRIQGGAKIGHGGPPL